MDTYHKSPLLVYYSVVSVISQFSPSLECGQQDLRRPQQFPFQTEVSSPPSGTTSASQPVPCFGRNLQTIPKVKIARAQTKK